MMKLFKSVVLAATLATGFSSAAKAEMGQQESVTIFYDNESHDNQVGSLVVFCDGTFSQGGTRTLYTDYYYYGCD